MVDIYIHECAGGTAAVFVIAVITIFAGLLEP